MSGFQCFKIGLASKGCSLTPLLVCCIVAAQTYAGLGSDSLLRGQKALRVPSDQSETKNHGHTVVSESRTHPSKVQLACWQEATETADRATLLFP